MKKLRISRYIAELSVFDFDDSIPNVIAKLQGLATNGRLLEDLHIEVGYFSDNKSFYVYERREETDEELKIRIEKERMDKKLADESRAIREKKEYERLKKLFGED